MAALEVGKVYLVDTKGLKFLSGNRNVDVAHLNSLKTALAKENLLDDNPILINPDKYILDGQHRVCAALSLGIAQVPCRVRKGDLELAQKLNRHTHNWSLTDFANSFASQGNKNYVVFLEFKNRWKFGLHETLEILCAKRHENWAGFRAGLFQISTPEAEAKKIAETIQDFKTLVPGNGYKNRAFVLAFLKMYRTKGYSHSRFLHKCQLMPIRRCSDRATYLEELESIYNYHSKAGDKLRFVV